MRQRQRYLTIHIITDHPLPSEVEFRNAIWNQLQLLYGELGVSRIGFWVVLYHPPLQAAIVRCQHDQVQALRAALASITEVTTTPVLFYVKGVSGTIRKAKTFITGLSAVKSPNRKQGHSSA
jgi:RNase P/RNase MRP subunit POP5